MTDPSSAPQVDFYVVEGGNSDRIACRLAEKAFLRGMTVYIRTGSVERTRALDDLLWTYRGDSFVPHAEEDKADEETLVRLGEDGPASPVGLLINVAPAAPEDLGDVDRVADVVGPSPREKSEGRDRFRHYREHFGVEPGMHKLRG